MRNYLPTMMIVNIVHSVARVDILDSIFVRQHMSFKLNIEVRKIHRFLRALMTICLDLRSTTSQLRNIFLSVESTCDIDDISAGCW
jgi:hypothetical protein